MSNPSYALTIDLPTLGFGDVVQRVTETLQAEGLGVLTEIDVKATEFFEENFEAGHQSA